MIKVHHNTAKKAKAHSIKLDVIEGEIVASKDGVMLAKGVMGNKVLDEAIAKLGPMMTAPKTKKAPVAKKPAKAKAKKRRATDDEDQEEGDDEAEEETDKSMIKRKYKTRYKPFKMTNGDDLNQLLAKHLKFKDEDGKMRVNVKTLVAFAKANDCWRAEYNKLNVGQKRLNVGNRLRAKLRKDKNYDIVWAS